MGSEQFHKPAKVLSPETRMFAHMIVSLTEEAEVISWYEQCIAAEHNANARARMTNAQEQGFKNFCLDLELLLRQKPKWRAVLRDILLMDGDTVDHGKKTEQDEVEHR